MRRTRRSASCAAPWRTGTTRSSTASPPRGAGTRRGALESRASEIFNGFTAPEREHCRRIFLRLTQPGEGTEDTKRRASFGELVPADTDARGGGGGGRGLAGRR